MRCIVCKTGTTAPGFATLTLTRGESVVVFRDVPASICSTCGEEYVESDVVKQVEVLVAGAEQVGVDFAVQHYRAA